MSTPFITIRRGVRQKVFASTAIYGAIAAFKGNPFRVKKDTDFLIDGFPRSANSFVEALIRITQPKDWILAHHTHAPASVIEAVRRGIPTLVLIRDPRDAIASFSEMAERPVNTEVLLREYISFYRAVVDCRSGYILVDFTGIPDGLTELPRIAKERFDFDMQQFRISERLIAEAYDLVDTLGNERNGVSKDRYSPFRSDEDKALRRQRLDDIRTSLETGDNSELLKEAQALYKVLASSADVK